MKKIFILTFFIFSSLLSLQASQQKIEITSKTFVADDNKKTTEFIGDVKVTKGEDTIESERLIVTLDQKNKPLTYNAVGSVKLSLTTENGNLYKGSAYKVTYDTLKSEYTLSGSVKITEVKAKRELQGEKIVLNQTSGKAEVFGKDDKPVKFIFSVDDQ